MDRKVKKINYANIIFCENQNSLSRVAVYMLNSSSGYSKFLFTSSTDPKGWWMSEKLDGLRAYWDGKHFFSRLGNSFHAPEWFIKDLPYGMELDGELFGGRGKFQSTVSIVKGGPSDRWKDIKFHVSHPNLPGLHFLFFLINSNSHNLRSIMFSRFVCLQIFDAPGLVTDGFEKRIEKIKEYFEENP